MLDYYNDTLANPDTIVKRLLFLPFFIFFVVAIVTVFCACLIVWLPYWILTGKNSFDWWLNT